MDGPYWTKGTSNSFLTNFTKTVACSGIKCLNTNYCLAGLSPTIIPFCIFPLTKKCPLL